MPLLNYFTTSTLSSQFTWQPAWETLQTGFATMTDALWQGTQSLFNPPEEPFFMQVQEEEGYQVYSNWCSEVRRAERLLRAQLAKKQLSPESFRKTLLAPLTDLSISMISPLYYYLRLKKLEQMLSKKNYPKAFKEVAQEAGHRLREVLKSKPELARNYFYQDLLNHLIEHSGQRFSASQLLNWMSFYEDFIDAGLYQPVKQALADFVKTHPEDEIAACHYKTLITQLNELFQETFVTENSVEASLIEKCSSLNLRFLALAGLALAGSYTAYQVNNLYNNEQNGLVQSNWPSLGIRGMGLFTWSMLGYNSFSYSQSYSLSFPFLAGSLSMLFPLTTGQITNGAFELSTLNGTNGFIANLVSPGGEPSGYSIASGDINGDGKADVLIGSPYACPGGRLFAGASYVVFGHTGSFTAALNLSSLDGTNGFVINGVNTYGFAGDLSGYSIASGDINKDGKADVLIGAYYASPGNRTYAGASYVVFGHTGSFPATVELSALNGANGFVINGVNANDYSGASIASGDINADGTADVLIGAFTASPGGRTQAGISYVVFGHPGSFPAAVELSALNGVNGFVINGANANDYSGISIASGDINVDGKTDVLIGAPNANPGGRTQAGVSYVVFGHTGSFPAAVELSALNGANGFVINGAIASDYSGAAIASGDINADGKDDVLIGAPDANAHGKSQAGASYVVFGHSEPFPATFELSTLTSNLVVNATEGFVIYGANNDDYSGSSIASGDINGDGWADVLIGAYGASPGGRYYAGASYVVFGHPGSFPAAVELSALNGSNGFVINGVNAYDESGGSIASGNINNDGYADVLIIARQANTPFNSTYVIFGINVTVAASTPVPSSALSPNSTPSITPSSNNTPNSSTSAKTKIALGVGLTAFGLFAIGAGVASYKVYQRRKTQSLDLEMRGVHLSSKERRAIDRFILINDLDAKEAQSLYEQTGIQVELPEGEHYQKVVLGEGEFGKVRLAFDREAQEFVGVKKIKGVRAMKVSEQERLIHERLNGLPHILPLLYSKITEDSQRKPAFYQFIRLAGFGNGERLCQQLAQITDAELKWKLIQHVGQGLLTGVGAMHGKNTYHLDIKPQNYMLTISGTVYVIDFGCTREFKPAEACWIADGATGDVSCFSPERLANFRYCLQKKGQEIGPATETVERYDAEKADAWSIGLVLLELILGRYPLSDNNDGFISRLNHWDSTYLKQLLETALAEASKGLKQRGQSLLEIIKGLLTIDPAQRLTVTQALQHPLFEETVFKTEELTHQFRALNELGSTDKTITNKETTRRDISLYSATTASHSNDPNYGSVSVMALKA